MSILLPWQTLPNTSREYSLISSVQFSRSVMSNVLQPHGLQHARLPCPSPTPGACLNSCALSQWCHPTISSSVVPFSSCLQSFPASGSFLWVSSSHQVAKILELQLQHQFFHWIFRTDFVYDWKVWSPYSPRDSQSSPAPQFKSIHSSVLSLLYGPTLGSIQDYWKNHSFDYMIVGKVISLLFNMLLRFVIAFLPRSKCAFNFIAAITICSDFGPQENKVCHCPLFPHLFAMKWWDQMPWS